VSLHRVTYSKEMRAEAKAKGLGLWTIDVQWGGWRSTWQGFADGRITRMVRRFANKISAIEAAAPNPPPPKENP